MVRHRGQRRARSGVWDSLLALALFAVLVGYLVHRARGMSPWAPSPSLPSWAFPDGTWGEGVWGAGGGGGGRSTTDRRPPRRSSAREGGRVTRGNDGAAAAPVAAEHSPPRPLPAGVASLQESPHVALGVPTDGDPSDDILLDERSFVVSYNPERNGPNWVSWELERAHLGDVRRANRFHADPLLPAIYYHVEPHDYAHSGYDRGHLCPSGDRTRDEIDNLSTFLMTNMLPQAHELNSGPWEKLEEHERLLIHQADVALHIVAGGVFDKAPRTIGHNVGVPRALYKIIVRLARGQKPSDLREGADLIAVVMPNDSSAGERAWTDFATTVADVEHQTGYAFLSALPPSVRADLESRPIRLPVTR